MNQLHEQLASLLEYPGPDWDANVAACKKVVFGSSPDLLTSFTTFCDGAKDLPVSSLQELYTRTFDLNPVCTLDIGYHLFGENYKRGVFLANLRETEAAYELGQEHQLPDYLPVLLRLVARLGDEELRAALIIECLIPALAKMLKAFGDRDNPYRHLLEMVLTALQLEAGVNSSEPAERSFFRRASLPVLQPA